MLLCSADCRGNAANCLYPHELDIRNLSDLRNAVRQDYVGARYKNGHRSSENFQYADCLIMDCDNDFSDDPDDWITPEKLLASFPDVTIGIHHSRNSGKKKNGKAARPKFHPLFAISPVTSAKDYAALKQRLCEYYPYFDTNALDAARFFFGTEPARVEFRPGTITLETFLREQDSLEAAFDAELGTGSYGQLRIPEGSRNATLNHLAGKLLLRYGDTPEAEENFRRLADCCDVPLRDRELKTIWDSAKKFAKKVSGQPGYIPPDLYNQLCRLRPVQNGVNDTSDMGQATVLIREYGDRLAWTKELGYLWYDGTKWVESEQDASAQCQKLLNRQLEEAETAVSITKQKLLDLGIPETTLNQSDAAVRKMLPPSAQAAWRTWKDAEAYLKFVIKHRDEKYIKSALNVSRPAIQKSVQDFDAQEFLLNTPAGTYDLRKGVDGLQPHRPEDYLMKCTLVAPDLKGMDLWMDAVNLFFCRDQELIEYVQMVVGLAAVGKVYNELLIIAYGSGSNGKSTFWNTSARVLGSYSGMISSDMLITGGNRNIQYGLAELKGKRLVIAAELPENVRLSTATVKQMCSTDPISAEKKYQAPFDFIPTHTPVLYTNYKPNVSALDDGTWRRLRILPFNAKITGNGDIKNYTEYLLENAGGAVLAWIIEGARKAIEADFKIPVPACVADATADYRQENNWLQQFLDDCCIVKHGLVQASGELYQRYRKWCDSTKEYCKSARGFSEALASAGFEKKKTSSGAKIFGLQLKPDTDLDFLEETGDFLS